MKKVIATISLVIIMIAIILTAIFIPKEKSDFRIGVLGEIILPDKNGSTHLKESLKVLRNEKCDVIVITGNLTNGEQEKYYKIFNETVQNVFGEKRPLIIYPQSSNDEDLTIYSKYFGKEIDLIKTEKANFIKLPYRKTITDNYIEEVKNILESVKLENKKTFIISETPPKGTFYGSEYGSESLKNLINGYSNIVWLSSGKYSSLSHKSVYNYQTNYYIGTEPLNQLKTESTPLIHYKKEGRGLILSLKENNIKVENWNFTKGKKEEEKEISSYLQISKNKPVFNNGKYKFIEEYNKTYLNFSCADSDNFIYAYFLIFTYKNGHFTQNMYQSDYFLGINQMSNNYIIDITNSTKNLYEIDIIAIDDYGNESTMFNCNYAFRNVDNEF